MRFVLRPTIAMLIAAASPLSHAAPLTLVSEFGVGSGFQAADINRLGQIVGINGDSNSVQMWQGDQFSTVATSTDSLELVALNNQGAVLYNTVDASGGLHYTLAQGANTQALGATIPSLTLNGLNDAGTSVGLYMSSNGMACGISIGASGTASGGTCVDGVHAGYQAINNHDGRVLSTIDGGGQMQTFLEAANGARMNLTAMSYVAGLNDNGQVAGISNGHAIVVNQDGHSIDLLASVGSATNAKVYDINNAGQVVGQYDDASGHTVAFLWDASQGLTQLDGAVASLNLQRMDNTRIGLNDLGQVVLTVYDLNRNDLGTAVLQSTVPSVPEPSIYMLMGLGLVSISLACRQARKPMDY